MPLSLFTHSVAISSEPDASPLLPRIPPWMIPLIHSYSSDIDEVVDMIFVRGDKSFRTSRGSRGVNFAN